MPSNFKEYKIEPPTVTESVLELLLEYKDTINNIQVQKEQIRIIEHQELHVRTNNLNAKEEEISLEATLAIKKWSDDLSSSTYDLQHITQQLREICLPNDLESSDRYIVVKKSFSFRFNPDGKSIELDL